VVVIGVVSAVMTIIEQRVAKDGHSHSRARQCPGSGYGAKAARAS
jgi:hypothetical protein